LLVVRQTPGFSSAVADADPTVVGPRLRMTSQLVCVFPKQMRRTGPSLRQ
jgi:hypothetical protein